MMRLDKLSDHSALMMQLAVTPLPAARSAHRRRVQQRVIRLLDPLGSDAQRDPQRDPNAATRSAGSACAAMT
jgi:hypothetical protein